ncbi:MAG: hypothetical protein OEM94_02880, partial [Acidimicrobiia bacterium]|nr:hypothetical protein [Acidimicrobiia bacterium]
VPPLIISDCEFHPDGVVPDDGDTFIFFFHDGASVEPCHDSGSGFDLPGGFGWLDIGADPDGVAYDCGIYLVRDEKYDADPGASPSTGCSPETLKDSLMPPRDGSEHGPTVLPYFKRCEEGAVECVDSGVEGLGNNIQYTVAGYGGFHVLGYNFGGQYKEIMPDGSLPCTGDERCIAGYHTPVTIHDGELGGPDRGVILIKLTN